jgi:hypothetical protein
MRLHSPSQIVLWAALALCHGCADSPGDTDAGPCAASAASGVWLLPFGPLTQEIGTEGTASVTVVVVKGSVRQGEGKPLSALEVAFRLITASGDVSLSEETVPTGADGLASTTLEAGSEEGVYQVEASAQGTCPTTFTIDVRRPLRQLRAVTPSPLDTFTATRVPLAVEATTDGYAKLKGEEIEFKLGMGKSPDATLRTVDGLDDGDALTVKTDVAGRATVMLLTGSTPIPQLVVEASMSGTAPVQFVVRIHQGHNKACKDDEECPLGYTCLGGLCEAPPTAPATGCTSDADCAAPTVCDVATGQCLQPTGTACDPIEGTGCAPGEVCVGYTCAKLPTGCSDNSDCPPGWVCDNGACVPGGSPPTGGCKVPADCPAGNTCVNGVCTPKSNCIIVHSPDRLAGTWSYDSTLHLQQALGPVFKGLLATGSLLSAIIEGTFAIPGLPSSVSSTVGKYLKQLIDQYVPPWGQQLVLALGDLDDILKDMRVLSTVETTSVGKDSYVNSEQWDLVEFTFNGQPISTPPSAVPQIGQVTIPSYTSHEVCGVLFIDKHQVGNAMGGAVLWAVNAALSVVTCSVKNVPCYSSVDQALQQTIDCQALGQQLDSVVKSIWSGAPSVAGLVTQACNAEKQKLIGELTKELAALTTQLSLLQLSGTVAIPDPPGDTQLTGGEWYGVLGNSSSKHNFEGEFSAKRQ